MTLLAWSADYIPTGLYTKRTLYQLACDWIYIRPILIQIYLFQRSQEGGTMERPPIPNRKYCWRKLVLSSMVITFGEETEIPWIISKELWKSQFSVESFIRISQSFQYFLQIWANNALNFWIRRQSQVDSRQKLKEFSSPFKELLLSLDNLVRFLINL